MINREELIEAFNCTREDPILGFFGGYRFMSNFWMCPVVYEGVLYKSSEHAYMCQKTFDEEVRTKIRETAKPMHAKNNARAALLRPDWEDVKLTIMYEVVYAKFTQNAHLKELLLLTGDRYLEETNTWGDVIWGVCGEEGTNFLGQVLMLVRQQLRGTL